MERSESVSYSINIAIEFHLMYALDSKNLELIASIKRLAYLINIEYRVQNTQVIVVLLDQVDEFT